MNCFSKVYGHIYSVLATFWPLGLWIIINYGIFNNHYTMYKNAPEHLYLRNIIGRGLCISRATAAMLNFSCCFLVLSMCRTVNMLLHYILSLISRSVLLFWIKNSKTIHTFFASTVILESVVHTIAHFINAMNFSLNYDAEHPPLNWAKFSGQPVLEIILTSVAGITGVFMMFFLSLMCVTALKCVRKAHYQVFWIVHHLYLPFLMLLLCHPLSGQLKELADPYFVKCLEKSNNLSLKDIELDNYYMRNKSRCDATPVFIPMGSETLMWITPPLLVNVFDLIFWTMKRNWKKLHVLKVARLPGSVIHLVLQSPSKNFCQPGQYILLQCPAISSLEWHPFSVVSFCPSEQPSLSVFIRPKGDWTEELLSHVLVPFSHETHATELLSKFPNKPVIFLVDGPFRSPLEEVLNSSIAVCIAAGIGITPFLGVLNHILNTSVNNAPRRFHLLWILQDSEHLLWCAKSLCALHEKFWQSNVPDRFLIQIHVTKNYNAANIQKVMNKEYTLLVRRIWKGRPKWSDVFNQLTEMYAKNKVHVYACGPKGLISEVEGWCKIMKHKKFQITFSHEIF